MKERVIPFLNVENPKDWSNSNISYSQFTLYDNCPLQWKLQYIDKIKDKSPNINFIFGTAIHRTIQKWLVVMYSKTIKASDQMNLEDEFKEAYFEEINKVKKKWGSMGDITQEILEEYYLDGLEILDWVKKKRDGYFQPTKQDLLGIEIPIYTQVLDSHKVFFEGFIDYVLMDRQEPKTLYVNDIKTSKGGWGKYMKKDTSKTAQLLIYKKFFADFLEVELDKFKVEYFIVKRKLDPNNLWPQRRVQTFVPANGKVSINKTMKRLHAFITENFTSEGKFLTHERKAIKGERANNCKFCMFKRDYVRCPQEKRAVH